MQIAALNAAGWRAGFQGLISDAYLTAYDGLPRLRHETLAEPARTTSSWSPSTGRR